jgi:succinylglutamate desuccinylase
VPALNGALAAGAIAMAAFAAPDPERAQREVVGHSVRGEPIVARAWGDHDARRKVLVVGSIHGDETQGHRIVGRLTGKPASRLNDVELWTVKTVNPDGVADDARGNANAVDLNRNFPWNWKAIPPSSGYYSGPSAVSETETRAVRDFLRDLRPEVTIYYHQPWGRTLIPCDRRGRKVAKRYASLSGLKARDCFPSPPGSATGYQGNRLRQRAFVVELPGRALRAGEVGRHARAVAEIAAPG